MVVNYVCQVVCGQFVGPFPEHLVVESRAVYADMPSDHIVHLYHRVLGHLEPDGPGSGLAEQAFCLFLAESQ